MRDHLEHEVRYEYNDAGRVTKQILPDLREIAFAFAIAGGDAGGTVEGSV